MLLSPADECALLCAGKNSAELWMGTITHICAHRICWTCGADEGRNAKFCGPEGSSCVVHPKDEDLAEIEKFLQCSRPDPTDGSWVERCNSRLGGLIQDMNIEFFLADGFWPDNVQIRKGEEEMTGTDDAGEVTVTISPYLTSEQLQPLALKIVYARDKWVADHIASSGLGQPGHLRTARGGVVGGGAALSAPIGGAVSAGYLKNGFPLFPRASIPTTRCQSKSASSLIRTKSSRKLTTSVLALLDLQLQIQPRNPSAWNRGRFLFSNSFFKWNTFFCLLEDLSATSWTRILLRSLASRCGIRSGSTPISGRKWRTPMQNIGPASSLHLSQPCRNSDHPSQKGGC